MPLLVLLACGDPASMEVAGVDGAFGTDAPTPLRVEGDLPLAGGAVLRQVGREALLVEGGVTRRLGTGELLGRPATSADGAKAVLPLAVGEGLTHELVLLERAPEGWATRTLLASRGPADRVGMDADGSRVAFVWAGAGGVAGVYLLPLTPGGTPLRLTNRAPAAPGEPPEDWVPLPLDAPAFSEGALTWSSDEGLHRVELP